MKSLNLHQNILICSIILTFTFFSFAQTTSPTPPVSDEGEVIKVESRLVVVPVSVTDSNGQPVLGLKAENFRVLEEGKPQILDQVSDAEKVPLEIVLLFDVSASTDPMFKFEQETAAKFLLEVMRPNDKATIFTVGASPLLIQQRDSAEKSAMSIKSITPTKQFTAFYDSVAAAAEYLQKNAPQGTRRVVVVISDGEDTNSARIAKAIQDGYKKVGKTIDTIDRKSLYQLTVNSRNEASLKERVRVSRALQNADTVFYSINPAGSSYTLNQMSVYGQENMRGFADETGGTAFLPKLLPTDTKSELQNTGNIRKNAETLEKIFRQLANELRAQYLIQYYSESEFPLNKYVKLNIGMQNQNNLRVRARQGYYVKN